MDSCSRVRTLYLRPRTIELLHADRKARRADGKIFDFAGGLLSTLARTIWRSCPGADSPYGPGLHELVRISRPAGDACGQPGRSAPLLCSYSPPASHSCEICAS